MSLGVALSVLLSAAPPPLPEGCTEDTQQTVMVQCRGELSATSSLMPGKVTQAEYVKTAVEGIKATEGVDPVTVPAELVFGGQKVQAVQYSVGTFIGWLMVLPQGKNSLMLGCQAHGPVEAAVTACLPLLERLLLLPGAPKPKRAALPKLNGKPLEVPSGCSYDGRSELSCADGALAWMPGAGPLSGFIDELVKKHGGHEPGRSQVSCAVVGKQGQCYSVTKKDEQGQVLTHLLFGETEATGQKLFVWCDAPVAEFPKLPRACALMFGPGKR